MRHDDPSPTCWSCGHDLAGQTVDAACPQCATPVWSLPPSCAPTRRARVGIGLGVTALLSVLILGPFTALFAIPALFAGLRVRDHERAGRVPAGLAWQGRIARWLGGVSLALAFLATLVPIVVFYWFANLEFNPWLHH